MKLRSMLLMAGVAMVFTTTVSQAADVSASASLGVYDKYLWRGIDLSDSTAVTQGSAEVTVNGFKLGVWGNAQLDDDGAWEGGEVNEVDVTVEYAFDLGEILSAKVGNVTYLLKDMEDTSEAYAGVTVNTVLSPTFTAYWDWDEAEENGLYYTLAVSHTFEPCSHTAINLGALVGYNDKSDYSVYYVEEVLDENGEAVEEYVSYSDWQNYELSASVDFKVTENLTITPSVLYSSPISNAAKKAIDSEWLAGLNLSYSADF